MDSTKIWSVITIVSLATLLVLIGQEYGGLFDNDEAESDEFIPLPSTADNLSNRDKSSKQNVFIEILSHFFARSKPSCIFLIPPDIVNGLPE